MVVVFDKLPSGAEIMSKFGGSTKRKIYMHEVMHPTLSIYSFKHLIP